MKAKKMMARLLSVILALVMIIGASPVVSAAEAVKALSSAEMLTLEKVEGVNADLRLDGADADLNAEDLEPEYADTDIVRVSIFLNDAATLDKFSADNVAENSAANAYRKNLQIKQTNVIKLIERTVLDGEELDVVWNLTLAANVVSANVQYGQIEEIKGIKGVKNVVIEEQYAPLGTSTGTADPMMTTSSLMTGSNTAWASGYTGAGTRIAIIDTGLDLDHISFDNDAYLYSLEQLAAAKGEDASSYIADLDLLDKAEVDGVLANLNIYPYIQYVSGTENGQYYVNEKVPFAINYVDRDYDVTHDNDNKTEHGSHVAGIAAANRYIENAEGGFDDALESVLTQGVAPDAQIIVMKVFGKNGGAYDSDYMVAIEDALFLGCDVVNLSLGSDKGFGRSKEYQAILDKLSSEDTIVTVAAGNAGSYAEEAYNGVGYLYAEDVDYSMVASPSTATNAFSVASVENIGLTNYYIKSGDTIMFYQPGTSSDTPMDNLATLAGDVNYILIDGIGSAEEVAAVVAKEGTIAPNTLFVCSRGEINFAEKANNAVSNGFAGTIVYNNVEGTIYMNLSGYSYKNPVVSITLADAAVLKENAEAVTGEDGEALYYKGSLYISESVASVQVSENYEMSDFSSWGPAGSLEMKPEITAPGGNIYSVNGQDPSGTAYENMSGTSMASPQIAGMSALVMQYIEETGLDVKTGLSARKLATALLMGTASPIQNDGSYASILQQGSGLANVGDAINAGAYIVMDEEATAGAADGKVKAELGDDPDRTGSYSFGFSVNSISDEAAIFSLDSDFFTQSAFMYGSDIYADLATTALNANVSYTLDEDYISASAQFKCDLDENGVTDEDDAQVILEYAAGNIDSIADIADLSEDGSITTYDAHLLLASIGSEYFMLEPGESVHVTVNIELTDEVKEYLDYVFANGAYVEGFVYVNPLVTEEGAMAAAYSVPVLGFYGNWSDASMYDRLAYEEYLYYQYNGGTIKYPYSGGLNYLTFYDSSNNESYYIGNPYLVEDTFPADKVAISPETEFGDMAVSLIRNAAGFLFYVEDEEGNVVDARAGEQLNAAYYYANADAWVYVNSVGLSIWETPENLGGFTEGDNFTVGFMAVPEYYETNGTLTTEDLLALKESGELGEGVYHEYTFNVDGTAPEVLSVEKNAEGDLVVKAKDNRHIAAIAVLSASGGTVLNMTGVEQDEVGETVETVVDMEGALVNRYCLIAVCDYAGNETYYRVKYNDGLSNFDGQMYAFTNTATRGAANTWMAVQPEKLFFETDDTQEVQEVITGGTTDLAQMDCEIKAAEYVNGYVYMITDQNQLIVAPQGEWDYYSLAAINKKYATIRDMAYNTQDGKLYALAEDNIIYSIDLYSGELTKEYSVTLSFARSVDEENKQLLALTIDDEGNFYAINNGNRNYKRVYLFKWSADDVNGTKLTDLTPVNNTTEGYLGDYMYNADIGINGVRATQSLAWDHDKDILYYAGALANVSPSNTLYTVDTATGKATITGSEADATADYARGVFCGNVTGLYIVPTEKADMAETDIATDLILYDEAVTLIEGAEFNMTWDVLPWNLTDKAVVWTTSDETIADVNANGVVTAVKEGTATITVTTVADPQCSATCVVTVEKLKDVALNAMAYNADGNVEWIEFNLLDSANWSGMHTEVGKYFIAGGFLEDTIYVHDGEHMYGVNADTYEVTDYGALHETWLWSDAAPAPRDEKGYFGRIIGIINSGRGLGIMDVPNGNGYELVHYSLTNNDPFALIAYAGEVKHSDSYGTYDAYKYYIMTESGKLYEDIVWAFYDTDAGTVMYDDEISYVGDTDLRLGGAGTADGSRNGSMYYDAENDYLIVSAYHGGDSSVVYAFHPDVCSPVMVGNFGADVWPVTTLYYYDHITELTVKVKPVIGEIYVGETIQLSAEVYPAYKYDQGVTWSSSDPTIATVDENGLVTALKGGNVTITATSVDVNDENATASASAAITVKPLISLEEEFHAYIETEEGGKWIAIDGTDLDYAVTGTSEASYTGAGVNGGKVYATDDTYYYQIDPKDGYSVIKGDNFTDADGADCLYMLDATSAPKQTVSLKDFATGEYVDVEVGGRTVYLSGEQDSIYYFTLLDDYRTGSYLATEIAYTYCPAAIMYDYSEVIDDYWFEFYYVLGYDGMIEHYSIYYAVENGELIPVSGGWEVDYITLPFEFDDGADVSAVRVNNDDFNGFVVSNVTENGAEFYAYDLENRTGGKMGVIADAKDLVGLSLLSDVGLEWPEESDTTKSVLYGYVEIDGSYYWAEIDPATLTYTKLTEASSTAYVAADEQNGKVYAAIGAVGGTGHKNPYTAYQIDPDNAYAATAGAKLPGASSKSLTGLAGVSNETVTMVDSATGNEVTVELDGYILQGSSGVTTSGKYTFYVVNDWNTADAYEQINAASGSTVPKGKRIGAAVTYLNSELSADKKTYSDNFLLLLKDGSLYKVTLARTVSNGETVIATTYTITSAATLDLPISTDTAITSLASMTAMSEDQVTITVTTASGVEFYNYVVSTNTLTKIGTQADFDGLIGLHFDGSVAEAPVDPDEGEDDGEEGNEGTDEITGKLYGYVQTSNGYVWSEIDPETFAFTALTDASATKYNAADEMDGKVYASVGNTSSGEVYYRLDPENAYTATKGGSNSKYYYETADFAAVPSAKVKLIDSATGAETEIKVGGYFIQMTLGSNATFYAVTDWGTGTLSQFGRNGDQVPSTAKALEYYKSEISADGKMYSEYFLALDENGDLYSVRVDTKVTNGAKAFETKCTRSKIATLALTPTADASMAAVSDDTIIISVNTASGVKFYTYVVSTNTLAEKATNADATTLVGLYYVEETATEPGEGEEGGDQGGNQPTGGEVYGYIQTDDGYYWAKINTADFTYTTLTEVSATQYYAATLLGEKVYATTGVSKYGNTTYTYNELDPANGYTATVGAAAPGNSMTGGPIADIAGAPTATVSMIDSNTGSAVNATVGGYLLQVTNPKWSSGSPTVYAIYDWSTASDDAYASLYVSSGTFSGKLAGVAYVKSELSADQKSYYDHYLALGQDGKLYNLTVTSTVKSGTLKVTETLAVTAAGELDLTATKGASMTMISADEMLISVNTSVDGVELYSYVISTGTLTKLSGNENVLSLVGLYKPGTSATQTANRVGGSLMSIVASGEGSSIDQSAVVVKDGQVIMNLSETEASTNGKITVTFDPTAVEFESLVGGAAYYAYNTDEAEEGKIVFTYASDTAIPAESILATLTFKALTEKVDTTVTVNTTERGEDIVDEDTVVAVNNKSNDNTLKTLTAVNAELDPEFDPYTTEYTIEVGYEVENIGLIAVANDENATVEIDNPDLEAGATTTVTITVTAENGEVRVYTINVTRAAAPAPVPGPDTGDPVDTFAFFMLIASACCAAYLFLTNKKESRNNQNF